jgi:MSHA biogenesis protein MshJ
MASPLVKKFESLSLRERAVVSFAILGAAIYLWDSVFMETLRARRLALESELSNATAAGFIASSADLSDPRQVNLQRAAELQKQVLSLDAQIARTAIGFVSSEKMVQVLSDVLDRQGRLELVSVRNLPVISLVPPKSADPGAEVVAATAPAAGATFGLPPYVHPIELIVEGEYADILSYLEALEKLPYRFRWTSLELRARGYPRNRVRIQLSTISLDSTWMGV